MIHAYWKRKSFRKPPTWVVFSLLVFWNIPLSSSEPTYGWKDPVTKENLICKQCPPGTCVSQYCTRNRQTQCQKCPNLYYTQYWNYLDHCLYCTNICSSLELEVSPCNGTHDRVCQCKPGYYFDPSSDFCIPHSNCPPGSGVARPGTPHEDTQCSECPPGTFSNSSTGLCQPHTNCSEQGLSLNVPGSQFHDTLCTACKLNESNWAEEASGTPDCDKAFINFAVHQINSPKRLWLLKLILQQVLPKEDHINQLQLQAEIYSQLTRIQNTPTEVSYTKDLLLAFQEPQFSRRKARRQLQKRFNLELRNQIQRSL